MPRGFLRRRCSVRGVCSTVEITAFQRSVRSSAPLTKRVSVQRTLKDVSLARVTLVICTDRKSTRLNSSHTVISYAVFCLKKKKHTSELQSHSDLVCRLLLE